MKTLNLSPASILTLAALWLTVGCGALSKEKSSGASASSGGSANASAADDSLANLEVLSPGELATKIYNAFGPGMTLTGAIGSSQQTDYLTTNASNFIGSISSDPSNEYASSFSIGYFLALAGLAQVVGTNYANAVTQGQLTNDCRQPAGAQSILEAIAPSMLADQNATYAAQMVTACNDNPESAISAIVQSYATALKSTL